MSQRIAFFLAAGITGFLLVVVGAAIEFNGRTVAAAQPTLDPALAQQLATREAAYQALIAQANNALNPTVTPQPTLEPTAAYPISSQAAAAIAVAANWASQLQRDPVLVDYQGTVAYEVALDRGLVYVDAMTGKILYNGAAQAVIINNPPSRGESESESDD